MPNLTPQNPVGDALDAADRLVASVRRWAETRPTELTSLLLVAEGCAAAVKTAREREPYILVVHFDRKTVHRLDQTCPECDAAKKRAGEGT
jgi:hypothetical protein